MKVRNMGPNSYATMACSVAAFAPELDKWMAEHGFEKLAETLNAIEEVKKQPYIKEYPNGEKYVVKYHIDNSHIYGLVFIETGRYISTQQEQNCTYIDIDKHWENVDFSNDIEDMIRCIETIDDGYEQMWGETREQTRRKRRRRKILLSLFVFPLLFAMTYLMITTGASVKVLLIATVFILMWIIIIWKFT